MEIMEEISQRSTIDGSVATYFVFIVNLSTRINKQFNHICVATARSIMKSCPTKL